MNQLLNITISGQLKSTAERLPDKTAFIFPDENLRLTFQKVSRNAEKTAKALLALGLKHGDHIGIWSTNCSRWVDLTFGAASIGVVIVPLNTGYKYEELHDLCVRADLNALFVMGQFYGQSSAEITERFLDDRDGSIHADFPCLKSIVSMDRLGSKRHMSWEEFLEGSEQISEEELERKSALVSVQDTHILQYTSGTTAKPKGAMLYQYGVINTANAYATLLHLDESDVTCVPLPLFHCFGNVLTLLGGVISGSTTIYMGGFTRGGMLRTLEAEHCTTMMGVPTMYFALLGAPDFASYDLHRLQKAGIGGSFCPAELSRRISEGFGINGLIIGYGLSEAASLCTLTDIYDSPEDRLESVGYPLPGLEVSLADRKTGKENAALAEGELVVRGYGVMKGYYKDPEETAKALDAEGWLHTGDLGRRNENGTFQVVGRVKDIIIRGGENISPSEVEEKLLTMENVQDCQCVGVPDSKYGEEVAAVLISKDGEEISAENVQEFLKTRIACYKIPRYVLMAETFPLNGSGKVLKNKLAEETAVRLGLSE